ncbi:MAG: tetratricopeptide repeat protein [Proteobacteria bacterium]|nr:tetratricopeptide repeat protein [Pseudomonadota bacterium]
MNRLRIALLSLLLTVSATTAQAQATPPSDQALADIFRQVLEDPENLDLNFSYANMAMQLGKYDAAITAYERMLMIAPDLDRVKLDMALAYARMGNYTQARELFDEVLAKNPPEEVRSNVQNLIHQIDEAEQRNKFDGSVVTGINFDSNANAAPASNQVDLFGVAVQLTGTNLSKDDYHFFTAVTGNHTYTMPTQQAHQIKNTASLYKTKQHQLGSLDLTVMSVKSAFTYNITKKNGGGRFTPAVGFDDINLGGFNYQDTLYGQAGYEQPINNKFAISGLYRYEKRNYFNTPTNSTVTARNGRAREQRLSAKMFVTNNDLLDIGLRFRQETTREIRFENRQQEAIVSHTHVFGDGLFLNTTGSLRRTHYKGVDALVNANTVRRENERGVTFTFGKQITPDLTAALAYQYKKVGANIQNYAYENERTTVSLSYKF